MFKKGMTTMDLLNDPRFLEDCKMYFGSGSKEIDKYLRGVESLGLETD